MKRKIRTFRDVRKFVVDSFLPEAPEAVVSKGKKWGKIVCVYYYPCQICGRKHQLMASWTRRAALRLKRLWNKSMVEEVKSVVLAEAGKAFHRLHPDAVFDGSRLKFRRVGREGGKNGDCKRLG